MNILFCGAILIVTFGIVKFIAMDVFKVSEATAERMFNSVALYIVRIMVIIIAFAVTTPWTY